MQPNILEWSGNATVQQCTPIYLKWSGNILQCNATYSDATEHCNILQWSGNTTILQRIAIYFSEVAIYWRGCHCPASRTHQPNFWDHKVFDEDTVNKMALLTLTEFDNIWREVSKFFYLTEKWNVPAPAEGGTFGFTQWGLKCTSKRMEIPWNLQNSTMEW